MSNPWEEVSLNDYENHMSLDSVKQLQTMNSIMKDATKICDERLKAAASLWKIVRDSDMKKEYSHELFEKFIDKR